ncbi:hypothetical protein FH608_045850 [Nonomuraea phyllanthi]|uniref:Uncharacterized protein n=1 Tax=Nonomuraea phyllanthi TaxID=2219224 RepID=A0A5C4V5Q6_9ACTN|nr:hypothetical protein [Nonomuraea phyllanthi]KAB8186822.1 hypothetical protein FH608_045850 [Nonomuraea phyllanthi]
MASSSCPEHENDLNEHKLSVIEHTYPAWRIRQWPNDMWTATRITAPTPGQAAAGLHRCILQPGLDALAAVLCQQLYIAQMATQY